MSFVFAVIKLLVYLLPVILLAQATSIGRYYLRIGIYIASLTVVGTASGFIAFAMAITGNMYDVNSVVAFSFYWLASRTLGITVEIEGEEHLETRPAVMIGNHQSMLDILWLGRMFPKQASIMAKKSIQWNPVLGPFMNLSGTVFVDRGNSVNAQRSLQAAGEGMKSRRTSIFIFAEGTRHSEETPTLLPFKKGAFHLAQKGGIPIVPVVVENYWRLYHQGVFGKGTIKVKILPPVPTAGVTADGISGLVDTVRDQMLTTLREISVKAPSNVSEKAATPVGTTAGETTDQVKSIPAATAEVVAPRVEPPSAAETPTTSDSAASLKRDGSDNGTENGTETEEDEGMVLVGRPN